MQLVEEKDAANTERESWEIKVRLTIKVQKDTYGSRGKLPITSTATEDKAQEEHWRKIKLADFFGVSSEDTRVKQKLGGLNYEESSVRRKV